MFSSISDLHLMASRAMCTHQHVLLEMVSNLGGATCSDCRVQVELDWEKIYRDQDSQSASILHVNFSGCPTYLTYLCQMGTLSHFTTFCSTLLVISWL